MKKLLNSIFFDSKDNIISVIFFGLIRLVVFGASLTLILIGIIYSLGYLFSDEESFYMITYEGGVIFLGLLIFLAALPVLLRIIFFLGGEVKSKNVGDK